MISVPKGIYDREASRWEPRSRDYPPELVQRVRELYESGMTIREVQEVIGSGVKVQRLMTRCGIPRRPTIKRNQNGPQNSYWKGDEASYAALHLRVVVARGRPTLCDRCGQDDPDARYEWANVSGDYHDIAGYERMCVPCHRPFDAARRRETGESTRPESLRGGRSA